MNVGEAMPLAFLCFSCIASLTWFFSSRPRLFIRVFVPADERRDAIHGILRNPHFCKGMRFIAYLQFSVASVFGLIALWLWLA